MKGFILVELITIVFVLFIILGIIALPFLKYSTTRVGSHSGYVTAIQQEGVFFHNYKVFFKTDNSSSQEDRYCVQEANKELALKLRVASQTRRLVTIHYDGVRGWGLNLCSGNRIDSVEFD